MAATILYFAWVREAIGLGEEQLEIPPGVRTVGDLVDLLKARGGCYATAFDDRERLRAAVDCEMAAFDAPIAGAKEIAFFPPVTGG